MPYRLLNELKSLLALDFGSTTTEATPLSHPATPLSEAVIEKLEVIECVSIQTFGRKLEPTVKQKSILEQEGFTIVPGKQHAGVWVLGHICTPKGIIAYS